MKAVVVVSGGLDSSTLASLYAHKGYQLMLVSFDYGQRHRKELESAKRLATRLDADFHLVDLTSITKLISNSALTNQDIEVPEGHYEHENMKATVVPNRNMIMASIAAGAALNWGADVLALGIHAGDHAIYPDCRPEFLASLEHCVHVANEGFMSPLLNVEAPFLKTTKADIARTAVELGVKIEDTWSCYKGEDEQCGKCATCVERIEAFAIVGHEDPTKYQDMDNRNEIYAQVRTHGHALK